MKQIALLAFTLFFACNAQTLPRDKFLSKDGKLRADLTLKDGQGRFARVTGFIWIIRPDGSWEHKRFFNKRVDKADRQGKLTAKELQSLADVLPHAQLDKLPAKLGEFRGANPHLVTLSWGKYQCDWALPTGLPVPKYPDQPFGKLTPHDSFADIYQATGKLLKTSKNK